MSEVQNNFETKVESYDAELFINQQVMQITLKQEIKAKKDKN